MPDWTAVGLLAEEIVIQPLTAVHRESTLVSGESTRAKNVIVNTLSPTRIRAAMVIAVGADLLQIVLFPLFSEGFISPLDDALDVLVCALLTMLVGWHYSFLPSFVVKVVPAFDLAPTWTLAALLATRGKQAPREEKIARAYEKIPSPPQLKLPPGQ